MRSLRARLALGVTLVLAAVLGAAGVLVARDDDREERAALDDRLLRTAELTRPIAVAVVQDEVPPPDRALDRVLVVTRSSLRLRVGDAVVLESGAPPPGAPRLIEGLQTFTAGGDRFRALVERVDEPGLAGLVRLEVTASLEPLEARVRDRRRQLLALGAIALGAGALLAFLTAGLVLRPLARLRATAASVAEDEDLTRRVPARGPTELRALAASFNGMLARLDRSAADRERALAATRRFAADAGHELRTPMTSMQATLGTLARHPDLPAARRAAMAEDALGQQRRLVALLDGLQALARGDASPATAPVDLADVVDAAAVAVAARHPGVAFDARLPDGPVVIDGWEPGLRSMVENLLENAARHGGRRVAVALDAGTLTVEDDGPGIPLEHREAVLAPFARLDGQKPGSGLGLALVAQQADHHAARLLLDDSPGLGGLRVAVRFGG